MRSRDSLERSQGVEENLTGLRRRFLTDLAWPESSDILCRMLGLPAASEDVAEAEQLASKERMAFLAANEDLCGLLVSAAQDADVFLRDVTDPAERVAWLATFALAVLSMLDKGAS